MNILVAIHFFPPHLGGMENVAQNQAAMLARSGHDVTVLTSAAPGPAGMSTQHGYRIVKVPVWNYFERAMGVPFPIFSPALLWRAFRLVRRADVIHAHDAFYMTSWVVAFWALVLRKPMVLTQHVDLIPHPKKLVVLLQKLVYRTTGRMVFAASRRIVILNSNVQRFLVGLGVPEHKVVHIANGVDLSLFHPDPLTDRKAVRAAYGLPAKAPVALFVGRFVPKKGFDKLLQAGSGDYHIAFAGGTAPERYAADPRFTFLGSLKPAQLAEVYRAVDAFILPSEGEGFPLTVQEAMASGLPVIISEHPGYDVYGLDPQRLCFIRPTATNIRQTLQRLLPRPHVLRDMATYSYEYAREHFSWQRNIDQMHTVYQEARRS